MRRGLPDRYVATDGSDRGVIDVGCRLLCGFELERTPCTGSRDRSATSGAGTVAGDSAPEATLGRWVRLFVTMCGVPSEESRQLARFLSPLNDPIGIVEDRARTV